LQTALKGAVPAQAGTENATMTVESAGPHATIVIDYIRRDGLPETRGSLSADEIDPVLAYVPGDGNVIDKTLSSKSESFCVGRYPTAITSFPFRGLNCSSPVLSCSFGRCRGMLDQLLCFAPMR
jgi:hypothetical protein